MELCDKVDIQRCSKNHDRSERAKMELLKRKIDRELTTWKQNPDRLPLIVKGARQVGKTASIRKFAGENYQSVIEINFALQKQFRTIFEDGFEVDTILKNISLMNPDFAFPPGQTLLFLMSCRHVSTAPPV